MFFSTVDLRLASIRFGVVDLPFFSRPPIYTLQIGQLVLGMICLRLALIREPITDKSGQVYLNRGWMKAVLLILGVCALFFSAVGFLLDRFWGLL
jgi:small-conductance mechanosensitive channel